MTAQTCWCPCPSGCWAAPAAPRSSDYYTLAAAARSDLHLCLGAPAGPAAGYCAFPTPVASLLQAQGGEGCHLRRCNRVITVHWFGHNGRRLAPVSLGGARPLMRLSCCCCSPFLIHCNAPNTAWGYSWFAGRIAAGRSHHLVAHENAVRPAATPAHGAHSRAFARVGCGPARPPTPLRWPESQETCNSFPFVSAVIVNRSARRFCRSRTSCAHARVKRVGQLVRSLIAHADRAEDLRSGTMLAGTWWRPARRQTGPQYD